MRSIFRLTFVGVLAWPMAMLAQVRAATELLAWDTKSSAPITCLYGTITVLATTTPVYFSGAQWGGVNGYCGIQDLFPRANVPGPHRVTIFSMWDTSPTQHPVVTHADSRTNVTQFTNEGSGAHTDMQIKWNVDGQFEFFLRKTPGPTGTTNTSFYVDDPASKHWVHVASINSPNGPKHEGVKFVDLDSWIENIGGQADAAIPKVALYSLWAGNGIDNLKRLTRVGGQSGSGRWGKLGDSYFAAEGSPETLTGFFADHKHTYGVPIFGIDGLELTSISSRKLSAALIQQLKSLPEEPEIAK